MKEIHTFAMLAIRRDGKKNPDALQDKSLWDTIGVGVLVMIAWVFFEWGLARTLACRKRATWEVTDLPSRILSVLLPLSFILVPFGILLVTLVLVCKDTSAFTFAVMKLYFISHTGYVLGMVRGWTKPLKNVSSVIP